ncbi:MAG TPA: diaminopimelate epimerase [Chitinophagaceae bacterium]|nr:diaminopimelate epimerase [Chitinophagaceae bacterium]
MIHFYKYQGAGNDFILIDNRTQRTALNTEQIALLCHRRFGIGADGLMLLESAEDHDFRMVYYNADGRESTMCGNGGRCITAFARHLGIIGDKAFFVAIDGEHHAQFTGENIVALEMNDVHEIQHFDNFSILNTGSPHYVVWTDDVAQTDVVHQGREIRNRDKFAPNGINVNFAQVIESGLYVRTYERGVEDETLSCGTGVTACAIAATKDQTGKFSTDILTPGGKLNVSFTKDTGSSAVAVVLTGPAGFVFEGDVHI